MKVIYLFLITTAYLHAISLGQTLFEGNCVTCHMVDADKSAPQIKKVVLAYKKAYPRKEDFTSFMSEWVYKPNPNSALMNSDIKKYEIMPELGYDKDTLRLIAEYLFESYM